MKTKLTTSLLSLGHAQTVNISDRTPQVRDAIMQALEADGDISRLLRPLDFRRISSLRSLDLCSKGITALKAGDFDGLTSLQRLVLGGNRLTALPAGAFDKLTSLQELNLEHNHLVGLKKNDRLFAPLPNDANIRLGNQTEAQHE